MDYSPEQIEQISTAMKEYKAYIKSAEGVADQAEKRKATQDKANTVRIPWPCRQCVGTGELCTDCEDTKTLNP